MVTGYLEGISRERTNPREKLRRKQDGHVNKEAQCGTNCGLQPRVEGTRNYKDTMINDVCSKGPLHVLVIAHPDDESMFFLPTLQSLPPPKWLLCLSNGDFDGLGKEREKELFRVGRDILGLERVLLRTKELRDSPVLRWDASVISSILGQELEGFLESHEVHIMTFDEQGVSGHVNHCDTHRGVQYFLQEQHNRSASLLHGWELTSIHNPIQKYVPVYHWLVLIMVSILGIRPLRSKAGCFPRSCSLYEPWLNWKCMAGHRSQFVWYRRLFVVFSTYTYHNQWKPIQVITKSNS